jgi:hypothetical protein
MKILFLVMAIIINIQTSWAQLKTTVLCPAFKIDVLKGLLNEGINPASSIGEIKKTFPCYSEITAENTGTKCSGVYYKDKGIYFFTDRDYIEIRSNFKGKLSLPLMGASRNSLFKTLGYPKIKDIGWDAFQTAYGTLVLYYSKAGKINKLQISNKTTQTLKLCE